MKDVGFIGFAGSGKDTAALALLERGWLRAAFADEIKRIAYRDFGWNGEKDAAGRKLLQDLGMAGRAYNPDLWIDWLRSDLKGAGARVWTDIRFENEAQFVRSRGGIIIRVNRNDAEKNHGDHESELNQLEITADYWVSNNGSITNLHNQVLEIVNEN